MIDKGLFIFVLTLLRTSQANVGNHGQYLLVHVPDHDLNRVVNGYVHHERHHHDHSSSSSSEEDSHEDLGDVVHGHPLPLPLNPPMVQPPRPGPALWQIIQKMRQRRKPMIAWRPMVIYGPGPKQPKWRPRPRPMPFHKPQFEGNRPASDDFLLSE